ncbi:histone-lysine N-methyltransferase SETDB2 [Pelodytes ibericus]
MGYGSNNAPSNYPSYGTQRFIGTTVHSSWRCKGGGSRAASYVRIAAPQFAKHKKADTWRKRKKRHAVIVLFPVDSWCWIAFDFFAERQTEPHELTASMTIVRKSLAKLSRDISHDEAKQFWTEQQASGKLDIIFKQVQNKLHLLQQKMKDGSATDQDYMRAVLFVNAADLDDDLDDVEASECDVNNECLSKEKGSQKIREDQSLGVDPEGTIEAQNSDTEQCTSPLNLPTKRIDFKEHTCGPPCLSDVNPFVSENYNPLKFPLLCLFQRRHAKSDCISKPLDVIYKAPCGRSLRDFKEVLSYIFQTDCGFLSLDNFSFNTYLQLNRNRLKRKAVVEDSDLSQNVESLPVSFFNDIDNTRPDHFRYRKYSMPRGYFISNFKFVDCCDCTDGCLDKSKCACLQLTVKAYNENVNSAKDKATPGYKHKRLQSPFPTGLYECNASCKCDRMRCQNRVVRNGVKVRLQVFKTECKGWGVRCMDDIDSGTFVCTFAGRIFTQSAESNCNSKTMDAQTSKNDEEMVTSSVIVTRKRSVSHSDSEIILTHSAQSTSPKHACHQMLDPKQSEKKRFKEKASIRQQLEVTAIKRPKTRTSILQKRRRRLILEGGSCAVQHSSEEDYQDSPSPQSNVTSTVGEDGGEKSLEPAKAAVENPEVTALGFLSEDGNTSELSGVCSLGSSMCQDKDELNKTTFCLPVSSTTDSDENSYYLDASKEGNVGRFFNHSCSPNLFMQHVFVETHNKTFPWMAFFTKRLVKAGEELTWDYSYDIGTIPDKEIPCMCGHITCRKVII